MDPVSESSKPASEKGVLPAYSPMDAPALLSAIRGSRGDGKARDRLEDLLMSRFGARGLQLVGSGTQALQLAIEAVMRERDPRRGRVALPAYGCFDLVSAAVGAGAGILFYDLDPETLNPDPRDVERVLNEDATALVAAPLWGYQPDWTILRQQLDRVGAVLIEDAAQAHGSTWRDRAFGTLGDLSVLSLGRGKGWTAGGGGVLLFHKEWAPADLPPGTSWDAFKGLGTAGATWALGRPVPFRLLSSIASLGLGTTRYRPPVDVRGLSDASAAIGLATWDASMREAETRKRKAKAITDKLRDHAFVHPYRLGAGSCPGYLRLPARLVGGIQQLPRPVWEALEGAGVRRGYPQGLAELPAAAPLLVDPHREYPGADRLVAELITIPTHSRAPALPPLPALRHDA